MKYLLVHVNNKFNVGCQATSRNSDHFRSEGR